MSSELFCFQIKKGANIMNVSKHLAINGMERCIRDEKGRIVVWCVGYSDDELKNIIKRHTGWYFSIATIRIGEN